MHQEESVKSKASSTYRFNTIICKRNDLYKRLEVERVNHYQIVLFETFMKLRNSDSKIKIGKECLILKYAAFFIRKVQLLSIVLINFEASSSLTLETSLNWLMKLVRFDIICSECHAQYLFLYILLLSLWVFGISFYLIYLQIYYKRNYIFKPLIFIVEFLGWVNENLFFIPYLYSVGIYSKYTFLDNSAEATEYNNINSSDYNTYWAIPLILALPIIVLATLFRTIYFCKPCYTKKIRRNRMHSLIALKDTFFQLILVFLSFYNSELFFNILCTLISIYMIFHYFIYLPFVALFDNLFELSTWTMVLFGIISHQISIHTDAQFAPTLIMIFIYPCSWVILNYFMSQYFYRHLNKCNTDPYSSEFKIRQLVLNKKSNNLYENSRLQIQSLFKESTKKFLSFKLLFVWESLYYLKYEKNESISLLKLSKINFSCPKISNKWCKIIRSKTEYLSFPDIEAEYLYYYYYNKLSNEDRKRDIILIKYIKDINMLNTKDLEVISELWELYGKLSTISELNANSISKSCAILAKSKRKYERKAEKMIKRHSTDPLVFEIYGSYKANFLDNAQGKLLLERSRNLKNEKVKNIDGIKNNGPAIIVVSGMVGTIGDILYLNDEILKLLNIDNADDYLGTSFIQFIPAPFDVMHNDILSRNLINGKKFEMHRPNLFLITTRGDCVEVTMHFRLSFFKQNPYFIADFNMTGYNSNMILHSPEGYIYASSRNIHQLIGDRKGNLFEILNNISYYYETYGPGSPFEYHEDFNCFMLRAKLEIDGSKLEVLYLVKDDDYFNQIKDLGKVSTIASDERFDKNEFLTMQTDSLLQSGVMNSQASLLERDNDEKEKKNNYDSEKVRIFCNSINLKVRISILCLLGIIVSALLTEEYLIEKIDFSNFISNFATMRFLGLSVLTDSRSLDLLSQGYNLSSTETAYRTSLQTNLITLKTYLTSIDSEISSYKYLTNVFLESEIMVTESLNNGNFYVNKVNLYQALQKIIQEGSKIANTEFSNFYEVQASFFFLYLNFPGEIFGCLNTSLHFNIEEIQSNTISVLNLWACFKLLIFIPAFLIIILSIQNIINLEKYNQKNWKEISTLSVERKIIIREKLIDRLSQYHGVEAEEVVQKQSKKKKIYLFIWKSFIFKILLLEFASILYYFISIYVFQNQIRDILISQTDYRFSSGLRRSLTESTYFWAREQFLDKNNGSFITNILHERSPFPSITDRLQVLIDEYNYYQKFINYGPLKKYYNNDIIDLMVGNPCTQLNRTIAKCQSSYISMGIVPSIELYINEIKRVESYSKNDWKSIIELEQYSKLITSSVSLMVNIFMNTTKTYIDGNLNYLVLASVFYFLVTCAIAMLIMLATINKIKDDLIGKIEVLKYFEC